MELGNTSKFFLKELGTKVDSWEQFDITFEGTFNNIFGNKGDFAHFSREHRNTGPQRGPNQ